MKEALVLACECGATLKASDLDGLTILECERIWRALHAGHESVTCAEANEIRRAENARRAQARQWWEGDDSVPTLGLHKPEEASADAE